MADTLLENPPEGGEVRLSVGDRLGLRLTENPTTGVRWEVTDLGPLRPAGDDFEASRSGAVGAGGRRILAFQAAGPGQGMLQLKAWQPWTGESSVTQRLNLRVTVR